MYDESVVTGGVKMRQNHTFPPSRERKRRERRWVRIINVIRTSLLLWGKIVLYML